MATGSPFHLVISLVLVIIHVGGGHITTTKTSPTLKSGTDPGGGGGKLVPGLVPPPPPIVSDALISRRTISEEASPSSKPCPEQCSCYWFGTTTTTAEDNQKSHDGLQELFCDLKKFRTNQNDTNEEEKDDSATNLVQACSLPDLAKNVYLQSLVITGCLGLTNLTAKSLPKQFDSLTVLKLNHGHLEWLDQAAFSDGGSKNLEQLDLSSNKISDLPSGFLDALTKLEILDLSDNNFVEFNFAQVPSHVIALHLDRCDFLEHIVFPSRENNEDDEIANELQTFSASNNPKLAAVCPWIFWTSPKLFSVNLSLCPRLNLPRNVFKRSRLTPGLQNLKLNGSDLIRLNCDCYSFKIASATTTTTSYNATYFNDGEQECFDQIEGKVTHAKDFFESKCSRIITETDDDDSSIETTETTNDQKEEDDRDPNFVWTTLTLDCEAANELNRSVDSFVWITPLGSVLSTVNQDQEDQDSQCSRRDAVIRDACLSQPVHIYFINDEIEVIDNGSLVVRDFGWSDRGRYECLASDSRSGLYARSNQVVFLDGEYRQDLYNVSLVYGFATAGGFLLLTLLFKLVHFLLHNYGCCLFCCCCKDQLPPKAKRLKNALESIEAYRAQQQDKLRENYAQQSEWIRQNCAVQMERVRENYNWQVQNLKDIRQYGSSHLGAVRDQYYEQMSRIRDYSTNQLQRVNENYIFQRQRLRKFSAQNYLKMRETRQYTRRTLHKVMENLPALYLDLTACKQGLGERQPSIEWDPNADPLQLLELERFHQRRMHVERADRGSDSVYFTPSGTPMREFGGSNKATPLRDAEAYRAVYHHSFGGDPGGRGSISQRGGLRQFLPVWMGGNSAGQSGHVEDVEVVVEHEPHHDDYYPSPRDDPEVTEAAAGEAGDSIPELSPVILDGLEDGDEVLASVVDNDSGETKLLMTGSSSTSKSDTGNTASVSTSTSGCGTNADTSTISSSSAKKSSMSSGGSSYFSKASTPAVKAPLGKSDLHLCVGLLDDHKKAEAEEAVSSLDSKPMKKKRLSI